MFTHKLKFQILWNLQEIYCCVHPSLKRSPFHHQIRPEERSILYNSLSNSSHSHFYVPFFVGYFLFWKFMSLFPLFRKVKSIFWLIYTEKGLKCIWWFQTDLASVSLKYFSDSYEIWWQFKYCRIIKVEVQATEGSYQTIFHAHNRVFSKLCEFGNVANKRLTWGRAK